MPDEGRSLMNRWWQLFLLVLVFVLYSDGGFVDPDTPEVYHKTTAYAEGDDREFELVSVFTADERGFDELLICFVLHFGLQFLILYSIGIFGRVSRRWQRF